MRNISIILATILFFLSTSVFAQLIDTGANPSLTFQVIQDQFAFDNGTIKSASIVMRKDGSYEGLLIDLKPEVIEILKRISKGGIGKAANLVLNKKIIISTAIIRSEIGGSLLITGISQQDAQAFIASLKNNVHQPAML